MENEIYDLRQENARLRAENRNLFRFDEHTKHAIDGLCELLNYFQTKEIERNGPLYPFIRNEIESTIQRYPELLRGQLQLEPPLRDRLGNPLPHPLEAPLEP